MEALDGIDIQILRELQKDAKLTVKELAAKVNLSPSPVFEIQARAFLDNCRNKEQLYYEIEKILSDGFDN